MAYFLYPSFPARFFFFSIVLFIPFHSAYRERDDIELIPRSFNSETPRQRDTFKHIEAGSCTRSPFALSPPFHIYLGLLHYGERGRGHSPFPPLSFLSYPRDYRPTRGERISPATTFYSKWARRLVPARLGGGRKFTSFFDDKLSRKAQSNGVS